MAEKDRDTLAWRKAMLVRCCVALVVAAVLVVGMFLREQLFGPAAPPDPAGSEAPVISLVGSGETAGASESEPSASVPEESRKLLVYYFDVGQGDSSLLRLPVEDLDDGYCDLLIDTGEYRYADGLTDTLRSLGVETIESFVISHPHTDHMGCAARIVQRFEIGTVYMPMVQDAVVPTTSAYEALLNAVEKKRLTIVDLDQSAVPDGDVPQRDFFGTGMVQVLAPRVGAAWESLNNWSAVLRVTYGETSFLFPGDAERDCLDIVREDAKAYGWELNSTVLKASHHGSNDGNPSKWLKAVSPEFAVISCGAGNDYGHPHHEPLERLEALDVQVYRTDLDGTLLAVSDGTTVTWETGLPSVRGKEQ